MYVLKVFAFLLFHVMASDEITLDPPLYLLRRVCKTWNCSCHPEISPVTLFVSQLLTAPR